MNQNITLYDEAEGVPPERSGYRDDGLEEFHKRYGITGITPHYDMQISQFHRTWGKGCSATDIDFLLIEHVFGMPKAIFEYKRQAAPENIKITTNYEALINLSEMANIPLFAVFYNQKKTRFTVFPLGRVATNGHGKRTMSRTEFVKFSYDLRGMAMPHEIEDALVRQ